MISPPARLALLCLALAGCPGDESTSTDASSTITTAPGPTGAPTTDGDPPTTGDATTVPTPGTTADVSASDVTSTDPVVTTTDPPATGTTAAESSSSSDDTAGPTNDTLTTDDPECSDAPPTLAGPEVVIAPAFADLYTTYDLGPVPGIPSEARLGGCVVSFDDPNALLIAGFSEAANGKLYRIGVERGACGHIVAFSGQAVAVAETPYIDANLLYVASGLLFYSEWPVNNLSQILPGSGGPDRVTAMAPLGVANSIGGIGFVPPELADPGGLRLLSWGGGEWYHLERQPDGELFTFSAPQQTATLPNGPGGFAYVPKGSPGFEVDHVIVSEWSADTVGVYAVDAQGDPQERTRQDFFTTFPRPWGAYFEPQTGDYLFLTWGAAVDRVYIVQGFMPPPPIPQ